MEKSSHEGACGNAAGHLHKMHKEHGDPDHMRSHGAGPGGNQSSPKPNKAFERMNMKNMRKDG